MPVWLRRVLGRSSGPTRTRRSRELDERTGKNRGQQQLFNIYQELLGPATVIIGASETRMRLGEQLSDDDRRALDVAVYEQSLSLARLLGTLEVGIRAGANAPTPRPARPPSRRLTEPLQVR